MTNFTTAVAASADDVTETAAGVMHSLSNNSLIASANNYTFGLRFQNITIPPGSTVTAAVLHVFAESSSYDDPNGTFYGEAADNPGAFSTTSSDISNRTKTTASVGWATTAIGTGDSASPDLSAIIQEIIDRGGWSSGNALVVMFKASTSSPNLRIRSYDYGSNIPYIDITYSPPSAGVTLEGTSGATSGASGALSVTRGLAGTAAAVSGVGTGSGDDTWAVGASADDARQAVSDSSVSITGGTILVQLAYGGVIFRDIGIPAQATISNAYLSVYVNSTSYDSTFLYIQGERNPAAFTTATGDISNRTKTTASVSWNAADIGTGYKDSPDISTIIQELVDTSWTTGDDLALILLPSPSAGLSFYAYDNGSNYPQLYIEWVGLPTLTVGAGGSAQALAGSTAATSGATGALSVAKTLAGTSGASSSATGSLTANRGLSGTIAATSGATGALSVVKPLAGSTSATTSAAGVLTLVRGLAGTSTATSGATGSMALAAALTGTAATTTGASGSLAVSRGLSGSSAATTAASGSLAVSRGLSGAAAATTAAAGSLAVAIALEGSATATSGASGELFTEGQVSLSGMATATTGASAGLAVGWALAGNSAVVSGASGAVSAARPLGATGIATSNATGSLTVAIALTGGSAAISGATGALFTEGQVNLTGGSAATTDAAGAITVERALVAVCNATSGATGALDVPVSLSGTLTATSGANAGLTMAWSLTGTATAGTTAAATLHLLSAVLFVGTVQSMAAVGTVRSPAGSGDISGPGHVGRVRTSGDIN